MQNPFGRQTTKLKRASKLTAILSKYGFEDLQSKISSSHSKKIQQHRLPLVKHFINV